MGFVRKKFMVIYFILHKVFIFSDIEEMIFMLTDSPVSMSTLLYFYTDDVG